jgi:3-oxoacyl-[acyl-carrier-protein] synthase-3
MHTQCVIRGLGRYVPKKILSNADLERMVNTSDEWIMTRTGIRERRMAAPGEATSDMAAEASRRAIADAGLAPDEITHILLPTFTPDSYIPSASCLLEQKLGLRGKYAADLGAACSGFLYGLETARALVALHPEANVLVAASEVVTSRVNFSDRATCVLFGDGAGAAVVCAARQGIRGPRIRDILLSSDGTLAPLLSVAGGGSAFPYKPGETVRDDFFVRMCGQEVFKHAVRNMVEVGQRMLKKHGLTPKDVDVLVPHQANLRIIDAVGKKLKFDPAKVFVNVERHGNTSAAAVALALVEARDTGFFKKGDVALLLTFGGGFTWGSALLDF